MQRSRRTSWFLVAAGAFNIVVWPRFAVAISADQRAWSAQPWASAPTSFLWVHAALIAAGLLVGLGTGYIGARGLLTPRR